MTMECRRLGQSQLAISAVSFGAGPVSGLMVGDDATAQQQTVRAALDAGINWFDTAATYGDGRSEQSLAEALQTCSPDEATMIATKVRLMPDQLDDIPAAVHASFDDSLQRLGRERVQLLQLHNSVTAERGDLPTSICVRDVLGSGGVLEAFERLRQDGRVEAFGFTGLGDQQSLRELITSGQFTAAQVPVSLLTPFAAPGQSDGSINVDYRQLVEDCQQHDVGVIAIRVFAGGALVGKPPSPHTHRTKFFTLDIYQRDQHQAAQLARVLPPEISLPEASLRYVLSRPGVSTALLGLGSPQEVLQAQTSAAKGPLEDEVMAQLHQTGSQFHA